MTNGLQKTALWGAVAAISFALAILSAATLAWPGSATYMKAIGALAVVATSLACSASALLAVRSMFRSALTSIGSRIKAQSKLQKDALQEIYVEVAAKTASLEQELSEVRTFGDQIAKELAPDARSNLLQTEQISIAGKQVRAGGSTNGTLRETMSEIQSVCTESHSLSQEMLAVIRSEAKRSHEERASLTTALLGATAKLDEVEVNQKRVLNFLRREGSIQIILDRLQATERRLLQAVEGGALTLADDLASARSRDCRQMLNEVGSLVAKVDHLRNELTSMHGELESSTPKTAEILDRTTEIFHNVDGLAEAIAALGSEQSVTIERLETSASRTSEDLESTRQEIDRLHEELAEATRTISDSRHATNDEIGAMRSTVGALRAQWEVVEGMLETGQGPQLDRPPADVEALSTGMTALVRLADAMKNDVKALHRHVARTGVDVVQQTEALMQLLQRVAPSVPRLPPSGGFAMAPDSLLLVSDLITEYKPKLILELGSGTSTIWTGLFARANHSTVVSIDHLEEYRLRTKADLDGFGLGDTVDLRLAELDEVEVFGEVKLWYDLEKLYGLRDIDMLVVDGPPESTGSAPRSPAFPLIRPLLSDRALVIVDDVHREQESQMVEGWIDLDPDLRLTHRRAGRTSVLEYRRRLS